MVRGEEEGVARGGGGLVRCAPVRTRLGGGTPTGEKRHEKEEEEKARTLA